MSLFHTRRVWSLRLAPSLKLVLLALADAADPETHECWPGIAHLQRRTGYSDRQLRRNIRELVTMGLVEITAQSKRGHPTRYRVTLYSGNIPNDAAKPASSKSDDRLSCPSMEVSPTDDRSSCPPIDQMAGHDRRSFCPPKDHDRSSCPPMEASPPDGGTSCPPMDQMTGHDIRSSCPPKAHGRSSATPWAVISSPGRYNDARVDPVLDPKEIQDPPVCPPTGGRYSYEFDVYFWDIYPNPVGKGAAYRAFCRLQLTLPQLVAMRQAILAHRAYNPQWRPDARGRVFIPKPATWLRQRRFDDPVPGPKGAASTPRCPHPIDRVAPGRHGQWHCLHCRRELRPDEAKALGLAEASSDDGAREALDHIFAVLGRR